MVPRVGELEPELADCRRRRSGRTRGTRLRLPSGECVLEVRDRDLRVVEHGVERTRTSKSVPLRLEDGENTGDPVVAQELARHEDRRATQEAARRRP